MKRILGFALLGGACVSSLALGGEVYNFDKPHKKGQFIVKFKDGAQGAFAQTFTGRRTSKLFLIEAPIGALSAGDTETMARRFAERDDVEYVEANQLWQAINTPDDTSLGDLWGMKNMKAEAAWDKTTGSKSIVVGVIDSGIDYRHPDLAGNMWENPGESGLDAEGRKKSENGIDDDNNGYVDDLYGWDFNGRDKDPMDDNSHGTHCAGTIGAVGNNGKGVVGVNWKVSLMALRFIDSSGFGSTIDAIDAIEYAVANGAKVLSNSWGGGGYDRALEDAIKEANQKGVLFVAAAGNEKIDTDLNENYPSNYDIPNIISVAAIDSTDKLALFFGRGGSNFGVKTVDLAAPGKAILSTVPGNSYASYSGTSMATPHVAGLAALMLAKNPELKAIELKNRLMLSVDKLPSLEGKMVTGGKINALKALSFDGDNPPPPPDDSSVVISSLEVVSSTSVSTKVRWRGNEALDAIYEFRTSMAPITSESDWKAARVASMTILSSKLAEVSGLPMNFSGYLALGILKSDRSLLSRADSIPLTLQETGVIAKYKGDTLDGLNFDLPWGLEEKNGQKYLADSPYALYTSEANASLRLPSFQYALDLKMGFNIKYSFEKNYDFGYLEVSKDGKDWLGVKQFTGEVKEWTPISLELSPFLRGAKVGSKVYLRFRVKSDFSLNRDGFNLADIVITGGVK